MNKVVLVFPRIVHKDFLAYFTNFTNRSNGFLHLTRVGGSDRAIARGQRVRVLGDDGDVLGVVGARDRTGAEQRLFDLRPDLLEDARA